MLTGHKKYKWTEYTRTSSFALFWNIVKALCVNCAKHELKVAIFWRDANTTSGSSVSNSAKI